MQLLDRVRQALDPGRARGVAASVALTVACALPTSAAGAATARTETAPAAAVLEHRARSTVADVAAVMLLVSGLVAFAYTRRRSVESRRGRARPQAPAPLRVSAVAVDAATARRGDADVEPTAEAGHAAGDRALDHRHRGAADRALA